MSLGGLGLAGPPPRDLAAILAVLFVTYTLQFFAATALVPALLRLTPLVLRGFVWQLATYPFAGYGPASLWFLFELLILYWFGRDVFLGLGRRRFWQLIAWAAIGAAVVAVATLALATLLANRSEGLGLAFPPGGHFPLLQGQRVLLAIFIAAFATANRRATILLFFVLPIEARWFLGIEILFAFVGFLQTGDFAGFLGICTAVGLAFLYVRDGGIGRGLRQTRLRLERRFIQYRLDRLKKRRGLRVVPGDRGDVRRGPWTH